MHVLYGVSLVGTGSGTGYSMDTTPIDTIPTDTYPIMDYSYWHLVEMVYIYIYIHLYYYYPWYPPDPRYQYSLYPRVAVAIFIGMELVWYMGGIGV